ncbi:MAG: nucleotide exchange factor GrpE [Deltaproteobacteria bacterium]|nr:nucleotide exchange factor GrpE [Deltaproteobacteria bacterium]
MSDEAKTPEDTADTDAPPSETQAAGAAQAPEATPAEARPEPSPLEKAEATIADLEAKLKAAEAEAKNNHARTLRVAADFENHRKRTAREVEDARRNGAQSTLNKLLPVFDNLERATGHVDASTDAKSMADGLRMVMKQFTEALGKLGIDRVETVGKPFDPMVHESIQYDHDPSIAAGLIAQELQAGYRQGDALLRPALVVVSKGPAPEETPAASSTEITAESTPAESPASGEGPSESN